jgi:hypothetical protein
VDVDTAANHTGPEIITLCRFYPPED